MKTKTERIAGRLNKVADAALARITAAPQKIIGVAYVPSYSYHPLALAVHVVDGRRIDTQCMYPEYGIPGVVRIDVDEQRILVTKDLALSPINVLLAAIHFEMAVNGDEHAQRSKTILADTFGKSILTDVLDLEGDISLSERVAFARANAVIIFGNDGVRALRMIDRSARKGLKESTNNAVRYFKYLHSIDLTPASDAKTATKAGVSEMHDDVKLQLKLHKHKKTVATGVSETPEVIEIVDAEPIPAT